MSRAYSPLPFRIEDPSPHGLGCDEADLWPSALLPEPVEELRDSSAAPAIAAGDGWVPSSEAGGVKLLSLNLPRFGRPFLESSEVRNL